MRVAGSQHVERVRFHGPTLAEGPFFFVYVRQAKAFHFRHSPLRRFFELGGSSEPGAVAITHGAQAVHYFGVLESFCLDLMYDGKVVDGLSDDIRDGKSKGGD